MVNDVSTFRKICMPNLDSFFCNITFETYTFIHKLSIQVYFTLTSFIAIKLIQKQSYKPDNLAAAISDASHVDKTALTAFGGCSACI